MKMKLKIIIMGSYYIEMASKFPEIDGSRPDFRHKFTYPKQIFLPHAYQTKDPTALDFDTHISRSIDPTAIDPTANSNTMGDASAGKSWI